MARLVMQPGLRSVLRCHRSSCSCCAASAGAPPISHLMSPSCGTPPMSQQMLSWSWQAAGAICQYIHHHENVPSCRSHNMTCLSVRPCMHCSQGTVWQPPCPLFCPHAPLCQPPAAALLTRAFLPALLLRQHQCLPHILQLRPMQVDAAGLPSRPRPPVAPVCPAAGCRYRGSPHPALPAAGHCAALPGTHAQLAAEHCPCANWLCCHAGRGAPGSISC